MLSGIYGELVGLDYVKSFIGLPGFAYFLLGCFWQVEGVLVGYNKITGWLYFKKKLRLVSSLFLWPCFESSVDWNWCWSFRSVLSLVVVSCVEEIWVIGFRRWYAVEADLCGGSEISDVRDDGDGPLIFLGRKRK